MSSEPDPASACLFHSAPPCEHLHILLESPLLKQHIIHFQVRQVALPKQLLIKFYFLS